MYLHENHYYLISNHAVARNPIFCTYGIQGHFKKKMKYYLEPICDILAYNLNDNEFQILVRLKQRKAFEEFYKAKIKHLEAQLSTPESTYIFSQAMSNLQNSLVKKFNFEFNRTGTLMAGRFKRELIVTKEGVINLIQDLNKSNSLQIYSGIWADCAMKRIDAMTSKREYNVLRAKYEGVDGAFWNDLKCNLVGKFKFPQKDDQFFKFNFLQKRLFFSICKNFNKL